MPDQPPSPPVPDAVVLSCDTCRCQQTLPDAADATLTTAARSFFTEHPDCDTVIDLTVRSRSWTVQADAPTGHRSWDGPAGQRRGPQRP